MTVNPLVGWDDLCTEAETFDLLAVATGELFYFAKTGPGPEASASFPMTDKGITDAYTWLDSLEDDYYE